jgi:hypothetical protein
LFALFISPLADITTPTTYVDDNYLFGSGETEKKGLENCIKDPEIAMKWFLDSGLCVNKKKTEVCVFHRNDSRAHEESGSTARIATARILTARQFVNCST